MNWRYTAIMAAAIAAGVLISRRTQQPLSLTGRQRLTILLGAFVGSMLAAKLPFALASDAGVLSWRAWLGDGKTIMLGLAGGYFGVEFAKAATGVRVKTGDSFAVPIAVSIAIGRIACFVGGCCYGTPTSLPWGVDFGDGIRRHPTQLYESLFHLACAGVLSELHRRGIWRGQLIKAYFIAYFAYRLVTELIRPEARLWLDLTGYQWAALVLIVVFSLLWVHDARAMRARVETS